MEDELSRLLEIRAKVKVKAKSLNMTTLKNATKILDPGLSVLHHRKRLALTMCLLYRTLMLKLLKAQRDRKKLTSSGCAFS